MTIQEMHIGIDLHLQKVNSDYVDGISPEEKDWFINEGHTKFIFNRINPVSNDKRQGLQTNQKRFDDLRVLITPYDSIAYIKDNESNFINLPPNYLYLLNDRSEVDMICNRAFPTPITITEYYISFNLDHIAIADLNKLIINRNITTIFDAQDFNLNFSDDAERFIIYNIILEELRKTYTVYWEKFETINNQNSFIIKVTNLFDVIQVTSDTLTPDTVTFVTNSFTNTYRTSTSVKQFPNRLTKTEDLYEVLRGSFTKPVKESPVSTLEENKLIVFNNSSFILTKIYISYIRKPRLVSLSLNINSELPSNVHEEIISEVSKAIASYIETRNYNQMANEDRIKE